MLIGLVTSLIVRLPSTTIESEPPSLIAVDAKVIFGKAAASKKSGDWRCPSRSALRVSTEATLISTLTEAEPSATVA